MLRTRPSPIERRTTPRRSIGRPGAIVTSDGKYDCKIVDLSEGGAKIEVPSNLILPASFRLHIPSEKSVGRVCLIWRSGMAVGVQVIGSWAPLA